MAEEDPSELMRNSEDQKIKIKKIGQKLKNDFYQILNEEASRVIQNQNPNESQNQNPDEIKIENLARGLKLINIEEAKFKFKEAQGLFSQLKFEQVETLLTSLIKYAPLDEEFFSSLCILRAKTRLELQNFVGAVRDSSWAIETYDPLGEALEVRIEVYNKMQLPMYADYDIETMKRDYSENLNLEKVKSYFGKSIPSLLSTLINKIESGLGLPLDLSLEDIAKSTIACALLNKWGFEELSSWILRLQKREMIALKSVEQFGLFLKYIFSATNIDDMSEVFSHILPEQEIPLESQIEKVIQYINIISDDAHLIHRIGYSLCFSLAWTPFSFWNLQATLFAEHIGSRFEYYKRLWKEYYDVETDRVSFGDSDVSYSVNEGIGQLPPNTSSFDYYYYLDHGITEFIRLHAVAYCHKSMDVIKELENHFPCNTFYTAFSPIIFCVARDAMPISLKFILQRGSEINFIDATGESVLDASIIAMRHRQDILSKTDIPIPVEEYNQVIEIIQEFGGKSRENSNEEAQHAFETMFSQQQDDEYYDEDDNEDD